MNRPFEGGFDATLGISIVIYCYVTISWNFLRSINHHPHPMLFSHGDWIYDLMINLDRHSYSVRLANNIYQYYQ